MSNYILSAALELKDRFTAKINAAGDAIEDFSSSLDRARERYGRFSRTISEHGGSFIYRNLKRGMISAAVGIGALSGYAVKGAADMEKYRMALETALKKPERADEYMKWVNKFADTTPYTNQEVMEATVKLSAYGIDPKKVMTQLGDLASGMGKPLDQAVEAFADALTGGLERFKEFGITIKMIEEFGKKELKLTNFINKKGQITDFNKFITTLLKLMESRTKGSMKKQADTFYGMWSTISGVAKSGIVTAFGMDETGKARANSFYSFVLSQTQRLRSALDQARESGLFKKWGEELDKLTPKVEQFIMDALKTIKKWKEEGTVQEWFKNAKEGLLEVRDAIIIVKDALISLSKALSPIIDNFDKISNFAGITKKFSINTVMGLPGVNLISDIYERGKGSLNINDLYNKFNPYGRTTVGNYNKNMAKNNYDKSLEAKPSPLYLENAGLTSKPINQYMEENIFNSNTTKPNIDINLSGMTINTKADVESIVKQVKSEVGTELTLKLVEAYNLQE